MLDKYVKNFIFLFTGSVQSIVQETEDKRGIWSADNGKASSHSSAWQEAAKIWHGAL